MQQVQPRREKRVEVKDAGLWDEIIGAMEEVVHGAHGTARRIGADAPFRIAGKSGTAQVIGIGQDEEYRQEDVPEELRDHALFIAFAPADSPRIAVAIVVENGGGGSGTAGPIARMLFDQYLTEEGHGAGS